MSRLCLEDGGEGNRTPDLVNAIHALSQLSYAPVILSRPDLPVRGSTRSYPPCKWVSSFVRTGDSTYLITLRA